MQTICANERVDGHAITVCENLGVLALSDDNRRSALRRPARGTLRTSRRRGGGDPRVWLRRACGRRAKRSRLHRRNRRRSRRRLAGYVRRTLERIRPGSLKRSELAQPASKPAAAPVKARRNAKRARETQTKSLMTQPHRRSVFPGHYVRIKLRDGLKVNEYSRKNGQNYISSLSVLVPSKRQGFAWQ